MKHLEVNGAVRPLKWSLGVKWLREARILKLLSNFQLSTALDILFSRRVLEVKSVVACNALSPGESLPTPGAQSLHEVSSP